MLWLDHCIDMVYLCTWDRQERANPAPFLINSHFKNSATEPFLTSDKEVCVIAGVHFFFVCLQNSPKLCGWILRKLFRLDNVDNGLQMI